MQQCRPKIFNNEHIEKIKKSLQNNRRLTAVSIQRNLRLNPVGASVRTVQKLLNKTGYLTRKVLNKPKLSEIIISDFYDIAMEIDEWKQEDIESIIYTDKSKMYRQKKGYKTPYRLFEEKSIYHSGLKVLVLGVVFFSSGCCDLIQTLYQSYKNRKEAKLESEGKTINY